MRVYEKFSRRQRATLHLGHCLTFIKELPEHSVDLTVTSPPYCIGKEYDESVSVDFFRELLKKLMPELLRVTKPGGSICWQTGYHVRSGRLIPLDFVVHSIFSEYPVLALRNRIIWAFGHGPHCRNRFSGRHETILWYTKGDEYKFDLDAVRVPQKYPGKKHYKGQKKGELSGNPLGKNPSDVWEIPNVNAAHVEKTEHPCQFPIALAQRLVRALCPEKGLVFDPFTGVGSAGAAAVLEHRRFAGSEILAKYHRIATRRIMSALDGDLRYRPVNKPIENPTLSHAVATKPKHFA